MLKLTVPGLLQVRRRRPARIRANDLGYRTWGVILNTLELMLPVTKTLPDPSVAIPAARARASTVPATPTESMIWVICPYVAPLMGTVAPLMGINALIQIAIDLKCLGLVG